MPEYDYKSGEERIVKKRKVAKATDLEKAAADHAKKWRVSMAERDRQIEESLGRRGTRI